MAVQASPMTTPGGVASYILSDVNMGFPTKSERFSSVTEILSESLLTILYAAFRKT